MPSAYYFTHTQVRVDPATPVGNWRLSDEGRARAMRVAGAPWMARVSRVIASSEYQVIETAHIFAERHHLPVEITPALDDSARPPCDFLSAAEFDRTLDAFFARPQESPRAGWESAVDAQRRIAAAVELLLDGQTDAGDLLIAGQGRVGTLLYCHLAGLPVSREHFQPTDGGNLFAFDCVSRKVLFRWRTVAPPL